MNLSSWRGFSAPIGRRIAISLVLGQLSVSVVSTASATDVMTFPVEAGDQLQVIVSGEDVLSGRFRVESDGSIYYPLLGKLPVAGMNPSEIGQMLGTSLLDAVRISQPMVTVAEYAPVFLVGDVIRSGPFQFQPDMTVLQLVLLGGGVSLA
jgi:polysaccharide biosynthesis/export protein